MGFDPLFTKWDCVYCINEDSFTVLARSLSLDRSEVIYLLIFQNQHFKAISDIQILIFNMNSYIMMEPTMFISEIFDIK